MRAVRDGRSGRALKAKEEALNLPGVWSAYGALLQHLRKRAGLSQQQLGDAIGYSLEQVASVEQGRRPAKAAFTVAAERVLQAGGVLEVLQDEVDRAKLPRFFRNVALLETEALSRFSYDPLLVPGLLQTEAYAQALLEAHFPPLDEEIIEQRVAARLARQALLVRKNPPMVFVFIVEEGALRRVVGSKAVMREQLESLLTCSRLRNVELQVMPTARGAHSGLNGPMVLLESMDRRRHVYVEAQDVVTVRSDAEEVSEFWLRYGMLRTQALNTEESSRLIERMAGEL
ncbi:helix-turn-helix domain-containing protein [Streptomyces leeuwenhoekii]|uniref:Xre Family xin-Antitoxin System Antitoxin Component n=1 Tax=Streptomyces leeuwenhoekii TaxID=1437453 RepID=A0A0F7VM36_STRLW|nr:helix-turn-helix transcriptional regulator [Streptomyces leeuwenhoekii]CQR60215.1 Xre Family xin-Antitoxin System Antitoxin Component [Streptomyces leeuwenhoekii]